MDNKEKLIQVRKKFFGGGNNFRRDDLRIDIIGGYNCEKNGVQISINYLEKTNDNVSNWKRWTGFMDIDRMVEYITNERLFEGLN